MQMPAQVDMTVGKLLTTDFEEFVQKCRDNGAALPWDAPPTVMAVSPTSGFGVGVVLDFSQTQVSAGILRSILSDSRLDVRWVAYYYEAYVTRTPRNMDTVNTIADLFPERRECRGLVFVTADKMWTETLYRDNEESGWEVEWDIYGEGVTEKDRATTWKTPMGKVLKVVFDLLKERVEA